MLTIIHGDDIAASRMYFTQLKEKYPEATTLDGQMINLTDLAQTLEGGGLFSEDTTVLLENFITKKKTSSDYKQLAKYLTAQAQSATIILWEGKEHEKTAFTPYKGSTVKLFKLPQSLFAFLDSLRPNNSSQMVQLFHQSIINLEVEAVFSMLIRQIRLLLALHPEANNSGDEAIEEVKRMQDWQKGKLTSQARLFTLDALQTIFCQLFVMETGQKTGTLSSDLITAIDILLLEI